jgi:hypothetical protein
MFNNDIMQNFSMQAAVIIPIITAVVQAFKFWINEKFAPFIAMIVGIGITFLMVHDATGNLSGTILLGLLFGLASSGLYSGLRTTTAAIKEAKAEKAKKENKNHK